MEALAVRPSRVDKLLETIESPVVAERHSSGRALSIACQIWIMELVRCNLAHLRKYDTYHSEKQ